MKTTITDSLTSFGRRVYDGLAERFELVEADQHVLVRSCWYRDPVAVIEDFRPLLRLRVVGEVRLDRGIAPDGRVYVNVSAARVVLVVARHALSLIDSTMERVRAIPDLSPEHHANYQDWQALAQAELTEAVALAEQRVEEEWENRYKVRPGHPDERSAEEEHAYLMENDPSYAHLYTMQPQPIIVLPREEPTATARQERLTCLLRRPVGDQAPTREADEGEGPKRRPNTANLLPDTSTAGGLRAGVSIQQSRLRTTVGWRFAHGVTRQ